MVLGRPKVWEQFSPKSGEWKSVIFPQKFFPFLGGFPAPRVPGPCKGKTNSYDYSFTLSLSLSLSRSGFRRWVRGPFSKKVTSTLDPDSGEKYSNTPPFCNAILLPKKCPLLSCNDLSCNEHRRHPLVSGYLCSLGGQIAR